VKPNAASIAVISALLWTAAPQPATGAIDDFERHDLGPDWATYLGSNAGIVNDSDLGVPDSNWLFVGWIAETFSPDQYSEATISADKPASILTQVYVRRQETSLARYGFHYNADPGEVQWEIKYDGVPTSQTRIVASDASQPAPAPGDTLRIEVEGADPVTLRGYHNGLLVLAATDAELDRIDPTGTSGVVARLAQGATGNPPSPVFEAWRGGNLAAPALIPALPWWGSVAMAALLTAFARGPRRATAGTWPSDRAFAAGTPRSRS
jgi:hypothetical protein